MQKLFFFVAMLSILRGLSTSVNAQAPEWVWAKSTGGSSDDIAFSNTTDANGNVLVAGYFTSPSLTFGSTTITNVGNFDIFIVKYDALGNVVWAKSAGGPGDDRAFKITTDTNGNVLLVGEFSSPTLSFGSIILTNAGGIDIFIVKYNGSGNVVWAKSAGGSSDDNSRSITTDANSNVLVTGEFTSPTLTFGSTILTNTDGDAGLSDIFIAKYNSLGNVVWAKSAEGGSGDDSANSIATDASGNVIIAGDFISRTIRFGSITLTNGGLLAIFIVKYDALGNLVWAKSTAGTFVDFPFSITTDNSGNILMAGYFSSPSLRFGSTILTNAGDFDIFIVKYDPVGNVVWAKDAGGSGPDEVYSITTIANGNVLVTGAFDSPTLRFGSTVLVNAGGYDIFIVKFDASGNVVWAKSAGGPGDDGASSITLDAIGNALITGAFESTSLSFGSTILTNAGGDDIFIAKLGTITGIAENSIDDGLSIYPNPSNGPILIKSTESIDEIKIINQIGQMIHQSQPGSNEYSVQLAETGIYFIQITRDRQTITKKLIIHK